ncbi:nuclear movement family protein [Babesia caballi]|uniref:Nuclear migration protein nudC n=1 Tax=Babesia caballi TaxID=5871 RepID=A0AAV4LNX3_BABCB|nr:nuclear movement family protein [Babesia caballi]
MAAVDPVKDNLLYMLTEKCAGIEGLLDSFFSFLGRRTDFFRPPDGGDLNQHLEYCVSLVAQRCRQVGAETIEAKRREQEAKRREQEAKRAAEAAKEARKSAMEAERDERPVIDMTSDEPETLIEVPRKRNTVEEVTEEEVDDEAKSDSEASRPPGNGGTTEWYVWTQTLGALEISAPVPPGTKSRGIKVDITPRKLTVYVNGEVLFGGDLFLEVKSDECLWTLLDGRTLQISLEKREQIQWWSCVIKGHPEIDVKKIVPENSKLSDLDPDTRVTVEKMMYEQRLKAAGLPTGAQASQYEALEKFKKAHPELDFSKANINFSTSSVTWPRRLWAALRTGVGTYLVVVHDAADDLDERVLDGGRHDLAGPVLGRDVVELLVVVEEEPQVVVGHVDVEVGAEPAVLLGPYVEVRPTAEGVLVDLAPDHGRRVSDVDGGPLHAGAHFARHAEQRGDELGVDGDGLEVPEPRREVAGHPEEGVLVNALRHEAEHVAAAAEELGVRLAEGGGALDGGVGDAADVGRRVEAEDALHLVEGGLLLHAERDAVEVADEVGVAENEGEVGVEAAGDDVARVLPGHVADLVVLELLPEEELLVVGKHDDDGGLEDLLQPAGEEEGHQVPEMQGAAGGPPARVNEKGRALLVGVEELVEAAVGEEEAPPEVGVHGPLDKAFHAIQLLLGDFLAAELAYELVVVYFVGGLGGVGAALEAEELNEGVALQLRLAWGQDHELGGALRGRGDDLWLRQDVWRLGPGLDGEADQQRLAVALVRQFVDGDLPDLACGLDDVPDAGVDVPFLQRNQPQPGGALGHSACNVLVHAGRPVPRSQRLRGDAAAPLGTGETAYLPADRLGRPSGRDREGDAGRALDDVQRAVEIALVFRHFEATMIAV